jgi:DNA-binding response OmpR family regulator
VWEGVDARGVSATAVDSLITRLRSRLQTTQPKRAYLEVIRGQGVRLNQADD